MTRPRRQRRGPSRGIVRPTTLGSASTILYCPTEDKLEETMAAAEEGLRQAAGDRRRGKITVETFRNADALVALSNFVASNPPKDAKRGLYYRNIGEALYSRGGFLVVALCPAARR